MPRQVPRNEDWFGKAQTEFGKRSVTDIPEWVRSVGDPRLTLYQGAEEYIRIDGKSHIKWYFAPMFITFFLMVREPGDGDMLARRLSHPEHINLNGKGGAITFRVYDDRDLDVVKELLLRRIGRAYQPASIATAEAVHTGTIGEPIVPPAPAMPGPVAAEPEASAEVEVVTRGREDEVASVFAGAAEGAARLVQHRQYERSPRNRAEAIRIHGTRCTVCGFDFDAVYGEELARHYIEIHHVRPVSTFAGIVNPETDLAPVCSNCHSMLHREHDRVMAIEELRQRLVQPNPVDRERCGIFRRR